MIPSNSGVGHARHHEPLGASGVAAPGQQGPPRLGERARAARRRARPRAGELGRHVPHLRRGPGRREPASLPRRAPRWTIRRRGPRGTRSWPRPWPTGRPGQDPGRPGGSTQVSAGEEGAAGSSTRSPSTSIQAVSSASPGLASNSPSHSTVAAAAGQAGGHRRPAVVGEGELLGKARTADAGAPGRAGPADAGPGHGARESGPADRLAGPGGTAAARIFTCSEVDPDPQDQVAEEQLAPRLLDEPPARHRPQRGQAGPGAGCGGLPNAAPAGDDGGAHPGGRPGPGSNRPRPPGPRRRVIARTATSACPATSSGESCGVAVIARGVQQRALRGQPQVQLRVELRHPLMLSRIPARRLWPRSRCVGAAHSRQAALSHSLSVGRLPLLNENSRQALHFIHSA